MASSPESIFERSRLISMLPHTPAMKFEGRVVFSDCFLSLGGVGFCSLGLCSVLALTKGMFPGRFQTEVQTICPNMGPAAGLDPDGQL